VIRREQTSAGFFAYFDVGDAHAANDITTRFGDVLAEVEGMPNGAGFILYVERGRLDMLEGYGYDDPWPTTITSYTLRYKAGDKRDWDALRKDLG
jgi:hypothetical protein